MRYNTQIRVFYRKESGNDQALLTRHLEPPETQAARPMKERAVLLFKAWSSLLKCPARHAADSLQAPGADACNDEKCLEPLARAGRADERSQDRCSTRGLKRG